MAPNLKQAANARKAAKEVASKLAGKGSKSGSKKSPSVPSENTSNTNNTAIQTTSSTSVVVPGLTTIAPDAIQGMMPKYEHTTYKIDDPLKPSETMPQVTEAEYEKGMTIYEGTQRALKLVGAAMDTTKLRFNALGKQAQAFGAGIRAAKEFEIVKGDYIDWKNQLQVTEQKSIALGVSEHKTTTDRSKSVHTKAEGDEKLKQAEIGADLAREQTKQKQNQLDQFRKQLGELVGTKAK
jgi:hypothetical protein